MYSGEDDEQRPHRSVNEQKAIRISSTGDLANVDPYDYTVEQVVRVFENVLDYRDLRRFRYHGITGVILLNRASLERLKEDYGIWRLGSRSRILSLVGVLRYNSKRFRQFECGLPADVEAQPTTPQTSVSRTVTARTDAPRAISLPGNPVTRPPVKYSPFPPLRLWERDYPLVITNPIRRDDGRPFWVDDSGAIFEPECWKCDDGITRRGKIMPSIVVKMFSC